MATFVVLIACLIAMLVCAQAYNVGVGIYDITGPCTEVNFMGYAVPGQRGQGIHMRLFARSYVVEDDTNGKRIAYVSVDGGMGSDLVNQYVLQLLEKELGPGVYTYDNLSISGTHTHSGPAGYLQYVLYQVTSLGYVRETFDAWVNGIAQSILMAHRNVQPAKMSFNQGLLYGANINRSPTSYLLNPKAEQDAYPEGDTDKNMFSLFFNNKKTGKPMGAINWFAVHATSMNNTNTLVSSDNRGYASQMLERYVNGKDVLAGTGSFVSAFASTNLGDVSPNTAGPRCIDTGLPCDGSKSTCNGRCENCIAFGPGTNGDMFESTQIIGDKQFQFAKDLMASAKQEITGPIDYRHTFVDMSKLNVTLSSGEVVQTCSPAMGYAFAAGTTDGPGMFGFTQGATTGNPFWDKVRDFLSVPTEEEIKCQSPKPILINTGDVPKPYEWDPRVLPLQIMRIGNVFILSVPSEFTTMAGRRLRKAMAEIVSASGILPAGQTPLITIAGLANSYSSYVTTFEEYQAQRYEAASNIFGPHALDGYIQEFTRLMKDLVAGKPTESTVTTPDLLNVLIEGMPTPTFDRAPKGKNFGDVVQDAKSAYTVGETVEVKFVSANPRNNQRTQGTYLTVEKQGLVVSGHPTYKIVARDAEWETKFKLVSGKADPPLNVITDKIDHESTATISWAIPSTVEPGTYRICHFGDHKRINGDKIVPFTGCSSDFVVSAAAAPAKKRHFKAAK